MAWQHARGSSPAAPRRRRLPCALSFPTPSPLPCPCPCLPGAAVQSLLQLRDSVENWDEFYTANGARGASLLCQWVREGSA